jgi:hypothetical protein
VDTASVFAPAGVAKYGLDTAGPRSAAPSELHAMNAPAEADAKTGGLLSIHNPLTWFAVLAAVTLGLAGVSTSVRVGPAKAGVAVGKA